MNNNIKKLMYKVMNFGLGSLVAVSITNAVYVAAIAAAPEMMAPVVGFIDINAGIARDMMAPLLGSSVGLYGSKLVLTAMKGSMNDAQIQTDDRLLSNETQMNTLEANVLSAIDNVVNSQNTEIQVMRQSIAIQNKMLEFYQIESNSKLNVSDNLISPEIKAQHLEWQSELENLSLEMKSYDLKNIYKITEIVKNIILETTDEIDPRVSEIIGEDNENTI